MSGTDPKKIKAVARRFIIQYYEKLFDSPTALLPFYSEESHFFHGHNLENGESVIGSQNISECLVKLAYYGGSVDLQHGSFDIQPSANGGFLLMVTGLFKCRADSEPYQFTHSFFLARNTKGPSSSLFVLNDCLRFIGKSNLSDGQQTKSPLFVAEETKHSEQKSIKQALPVQKQENPEIIEVQKLQQPEVHEKQPQVFEAKTETITTTNNLRNNQLNDGSGELNVEDDDEENDSDYVDDEEQEDIDEDEDEELFDENEVENDLGSGIDEVDADEVLLKRVEGKWVPKKKPEELSQSKAVPVSTTLEAVNPSETKKVELVQTTQQQQPHHQHHHTPKHTKSSLQTQQTEPETEVPKVMSYAFAAGKNTSQASNPAPTNVIKKKTVPSTVATTSAPVTTNLKPSPPQNLANLYIGNLSEGVTEEHLRSIFGGYGQIKKVTLKLGIAFIEFNDNSVVQTIVDDSKQTPFSVNGQQVKVDFTRPSTQTKNQNGGGRGVGRGGGQQYNSSNNYPRQNKTKK